MMSEIKLTICIATFSRGNFIAETLDSILSQMQQGVELVVVDGASPDNTSEILTQYTSHYPALRYYREAENSGVDGDYDKAVGYAKGEYCWLMTDDDLLRPGAIKHVMDRLQGQIDLLVVNAEVRSADFSKVLNEKLIMQDTDKMYGAGDEESLFMETAQALSFIGCVVIRRDLWLARDRRTYYGSLFVHVGVIFQHKPIARVGFVAEPQISIRYGNAMWTPRGLEIWVVKWPELIWSFRDFSGKAKSVLCPRGGWHLIKRLMFYRATGAYTLKEYDDLLRSRVSGLTRHFIRLIALVPAGLANTLASIYCALFRGQGSRMVMYSLACGQHANFVTRWAARTQDIGR